MAWYTARIMPLSSSLPLPSAPSRTLLARVQAFPGLFTRPTGLSYARSRVFRRRARFQAHASRCRPGRSLTSRSSKDLHVSQGLRRLSLLFFFLFRGCFDRRRSRPRHWTESSSTMKPTLPINANSRLVDRVHRLRHRLVARGAT